MPSENENPIIAELHRVKALCLHKKKKKGKTAIWEKDQLVCRVIELVSTTGRADFDTLIDRLGLPEGKAERGRQTRAVRKAMRDIAGWVDTHNTDNPSNPIRVNFDKDGSLMARLDFMSEGSVSDLLAAAESHMRNVVTELGIAAGKLRTAKKMIG